MPTVTDNCGRTLHSGCLPSPRIPLVLEQRHTPIHSPIVTVRLRSGFILIPSAHRSSRCRLKGSTVACAADAVAPTVPTVTDNCGRTLTTPRLPSPRILLVLEQRHTPIHSPIVTVRLTTWVYTYTISAPTVAMPANRVQLSLVLLYAVAPTVPAVTDNCGRTLTAPAPAVSADPACAGTKTYTYTFTDRDWYTYYYWVYTYTISAPTVAMPANQGSTVACAADAVAPTVPTVTDNCGRTLLPRLPSPRIPLVLEQKHTPIHSPIVTVRLTTWVYTYTISAPTVAMPAQGFNCRLRR